MGILIYLFPALIDMVLASAGFICTVSAAEKGYSASTVANLVTVMSASYVMSCFAAGRIVTERNAVTLLTCACVLVALVSVGLALFDGIYAKYCLVFLLMAAAGMFFVPFQVFMKHMGHRTRRIGESVGMYTLAWSVGFAAGPFLAGFLWTRLGWQSCHILNAFAALGTAAGLLLVKRHSDSVHVVDKHLPPEGHAAEYSGMPDLAWMAWLCGGIGAITFGLVRGILPKTGAALEISKFNQGMVFFVFCTMQGVVGMLLGRGRLWMYRPLPLVLLGLCGIVGLAAFAFAETAAMLCLAAAFYGVYSGTFFFYLVFHALVHPLKGARYVSINEMVVGITGMIGPFVGGLLADRSGLAAPYLFSALLVCGAVVTQAIVHSRHAAIAGPPPPGSQAASATQLQSV